MTPTPDPKSLAAEARRIARCLEFHPTSIRCSLAALADALDAMPTQDTGDVKLCGFGVDEIYAFKEFLQYLSCPVTEVVKNPMLAAYKVSALPGPNDTGAKWEAAVSARIIEGLNVNGHPYTPDLMLLRLVWKDVKGTDWQPPKPERVTDADIDLLEKVLKGAPIFTTDPKQYARIMDALQQLRAKHGVNSPEWGKVK